MFAGSRPFSVDDAGVVGMGDYEVECGVEGWTDAGSLILGFKHGITGKMDMGFDLAYDFYPADRSGFSPLTVSFKYSLFENTAVSLANSPGSKDFSLNLIFSPSFSAFNININGGIDCKPGKDEALTGGLMLVKEAGNITAGGEITMKVGEPTGFLLGMIWVVKDNIQVDVGVSGDFVSGINPMVTMGLHSEF